MDDWRLNGQEEYLTGVQLTHKNYTVKNDHDHCIFCWHKFMMNCACETDCSNIGYCTLDGRYWICEKCYNDFAQSFKWSLQREN